MKRLLALSLAVACIAAAPAAPATTPTRPAPARAVASDPSGLHVGSSVTDMTFVPIEGAPRPLVDPHKPTVLIAFASWCVGCIAELPRTLADYQRLKGRVNFLGVDYADSIQAGDATIAKYAIPFPVERIDVVASVPKPEPLDANGNSSSGMTLHGITPQTLSAALPELVKVLPASMAATLTQVATHCRSLSATACIAYAKTQNVGLDATAAPPPAQAAASPSATASQPSMTLPHAFVISAKGIVVQDVEGYNSGDDTIADAIEAALKH